MSSRYNTRKRKYEYAGVNKSTVKTWENEFKADKVQILLRNAVVSVGSDFASIDSEESKCVNHIFINTLKKHNLKATNQGYSGRCWMFAGLNVFRHLLIKALELENFEFSETYLYFYDRLERSSYFLQWFIDNSHLSPDSRECQHMLGTYMDDGGYWNMFSNLICKYGVVPKPAMPETFQSIHTSDMNEQIHRYLAAAAATLVNNRNELTDERCQKIKKDTLKLIYDLLTKYLGHPPNDFVWFFSQNSEENSTAVRSNPEDFTKMVMSSVMKGSDFVVLSHFPTEKCKFRKYYEVKQTSNLEGGDNFKFLNLPIEEIKKYCSKSIMKGLPVWFAGDVGRGFSYIYQSLNNKVMDTSPLFGKGLPFSKGDRIEFLNSGATHAMVLLGVNIDEKDKTTEWQVENSWGYWDYEERGMDGYLSMADEWFDECVFMVSIHKQFLSQSINNMLDHYPILLEPWDATAPAGKIGPFIPPQKFLGPGGLPRTRGL